METNIWNFADDVNDAIASTAKKLNVPLDDFMQVFLKEMIKIRPEYIEHIQDPSEELQRLCYRC